MDSVKETFNKTKGDIFSFLAKKVLYFPLGKKLFMQILRKKAWKKLVEDNTEGLKSVQERKFYFIMALLETAKNNIEKGYFSKKLSERFFQILVKNNFMKDRGSNENIIKFKEKYGIEAPSFIVLSPTQKCNLRCIGCYASSTMNAPSLPFEVVEKITHEVYHDWGNRFMTISGGEPLMYRDGDKTLFDIWQKYPNMFFMFYTNGTLINDDNARRLAEVGNASPAISVEGWEKETDCRRGKGIFKKIVEATNNLKKYGVPFGVSITVTKFNIDILLDDKFYGFCFKTLGATYMWMFQLMPIGQAKDVKKLMITPEQRIKLFRKWESLIKDKQYPIADFWNSGVLSNGCIAYGRSGGYIYVDWNGNIMPCVFVPFYEENIKDLYNQGKTLAHALLAKTFVNGRKWQEEFGLKNQKNPDNWLMPCSIRDHWHNFKYNILSDKAKPEDVHAGEAIKSKELEKFMDKFDKDLEKITKPIWKKEYLDKG